MAVEASLTAQNTFTDALKVDTDRAVNIFTSGIWVGTLTVQVKFYDDSSWRDVSEATFTSNVQRKDQFDEYMLIRMGFKTGDYSSGTAVVRLSQ